MQYQKSSDTSMHLRLRYSYQHLVDIILHLKLAMPKHLPRESAEFLRSSYSVTRILTAFPSSFHEFATNLAGAA